MNGSEIMEERLTQLEVKISFQEDMIDNLNEVLVRQQQDIARLQQELAALKDQLRDNDLGQTSTPRNLRDDLPPHY